MELRIYHVMLHVGNNVAVDTIVHLISVVLWELMNYWGSFIYFYDHLSHVFVWIIESFIIC